MDKEELLAFEEWCIGSFYRGEILSPIHLSGGNEEQLIEIFNLIEPKDYVFSTYRSHYHALLKGVDKEWLKSWILENRSITVMNKQNKIISSALVGGTLPIAIGVAMAIKRRNGKERVWVFIGDMTASLGTFHDCWQYALYNKLPIHFVIENNEMSTDTPTRQAWGMKDKEHWWAHKERPMITHYSYRRMHPHYGVFNRINFDVKT